MKSALLSILFLFTHSVLSAQAPLWVWAQTDVNYHNGQMLGCGIAVDEIGNTYITGTIPGAGVGPDIFLAKYDMQGNLKWYKTGGGRLWDQSYGVTTDPWGNIYITGGIGYIWGMQPPDTAYFDSHSLITNSSDIVIVKYDSAGNVIWVKKQGSDFNDMGYGIRADNNGSFYITGSFGAQSVDTCTGIFDSITLKTFEGGDMFIAKYDTSGNIIWANNAGSNESDYGFNLGLDSSENVYVTGNFGGIKAWFDGYEINSLAIGYSSGNMFVAKYDSAGSFQWVKTAGGVNFSTTFGGGIGREALAVHKSGTVYVTGRFTNCDIDFGTHFLPNEPGNTDDIFLAKYNDSGSIEWVKSIASPGEDFSVSVATDDDGNVYVAGSYGYDLPMGADTLHGAGGDDMFVAKYTSAGTLVWVKDIASNCSEQPTAMEVDATGENIYVTGIITGDSAAFDNVMVYPGSTPKYFVARANTTVGIDITENFDPGVAVYPNPSDGSFYFWNNKGLSGKLKVMDTRGIVVFETSIAAGEQQRTLSLQNLSTGCYFLSFKTEKGVVNKKIIIQ